jgi:hypothetical protein
MKGPSDDIANAVDPKDPSKKKSKRGESPKVKTQPTTSNNLIAAKITNPVLSGNYNQPMG